MGCTPPGIESSPAGRQQCSSSRPQLLTALDFLCDSLLLLARGGLLGSLRLEGRAPVASATGIESALQRVALPAKDVITVLTKSGTRTG
jgi:hypothetical protein